MIRHNLKNWYTNSLRHSLPFTFIFVSLHDTRLSCRVAIGSGASLGGLLQTTRQHLEGDGSGLRSRVTSGTGP